MKKLLILVMVLAMASFAGATLKITGAPTGDVHPSDIVQLGIMTDAAIGYLSNPAEGGYYVMVANVLGGTLDQLSGITIVADSGIGVEHSVDALGLLDGTGLVIPAGMNGIGGFVIVIDLTGGIAADTQLIGEIAFHCEAPGDVIVQLYSTDLGSAITLVDSVVIHQIPEPVTVALLGLGGLFLRRRMA